MEEGDADVRAELLRGGGVMGKGMSMGLIVTVFILLSRGGCEQCFQTSMGSTIFREKVFTSGLIVAVKTKCH